MPVKFVFTVLERDGTFKLQIGENQNCVIHRITDFEDLTDIVAIVDALLINGEKAVKIEGYKGLPERDREHTWTLKNRKKEIMDKVKNKQRNVKHPGTLMTVVGMLLQ